MIRITQAQLDRQEARDDWFVEWYVEDVMQRFFANYYAALTPEGVREMVLNGRRCARAHGLETAEAQAHFIGLMWDVGPNFYKFPGFADVLARRDLAEKDRIDALYSDAVSDAQGKAAADGADDRYWQLGVVELGVAPVDTGD